jgi:diguanylate cyclase (GGDEF)-like protein/PAS domain S-box-containing protein
MIFNPPAAGSLARRFTLAAAALAAVALLLTAVASWWLVSQQQTAALRALLQKEADFNAAMASTTLHAISSRLSEVANSSIIATGLVDSAGKETYLNPYLRGVRKINDVPIQIMFTDFEGTEIANNGNPDFNEAELAWMKAQLDIGKAGAVILPGVKGPDLLAVELLVYSRTNSPEGALLYKVALSDVQRNMTAKLVWGKPESATADSGSSVSALINSPRNFKHLQFRAMAEADIGFFAGLAQQYVIIFVIAGALAAAVLVIGSRLAQALTRDLRRLESFSASMVNDGFSGQRADVDGSIEVANLARSINHMLDRLYEQHAQLQHESEERYHLLVRYRLLVESTNAISWEASEPDHGYDFVSPQAEQMFGYPLGAWNVPSFWIKHVHPDDAALALQHRAEAVKDGSSYRCEYRMRHMNGSYLWLEEIASVLESDAGAPTVLRGILLDITQRKASEHEIMHLAFYDQLTRLPNRRLLLDRLEQSLASSARRQRQGALLFIDLDNFKTLNDTLGHDKGDLLLQQVAQRLSTCVRESDTLARLGGDEFVVMLEGLSDNLQEGAAQAATVGNKILTILGQPYMLAGYEHYSTPSIGVALFKDQQSTVGELLKQADLAMYRAKAAGRNTLRFFDPDMQTKVSARAALEADLRQSLPHNEFVLWYQPQVDGIGRVTGAEALVRWDHPLRGLVAPVEFISLAEDTGLIQALGQWVLENACARLAAWSAQAETAHLSMAVNVSARQFRHPDFVEQVLAVLDQSGADPYKLKLELTESLLVDNVEDTIAKMTALKAKGVGFSLDDFGTGYSSLAYLKLLPLDQLKIDQSFVRDVLTDPNDAVIARTILALGQSLGLAVIAEGVETDAQRAFLARHGCHAYQGYLFSRPLPAEEFDAFMRGMYVTG